MQETGEYDIGTRMPATVILLHTVYHIAHLIEHGKHERTGQFTTKMILHVSQLVLEHVEIALESIGFILCKTDNRMIFGEKKHHRDISDITYRLIEELYRHNDTYSINIKTRLIVSHDMPL